MRGVVVFLRWAPAIVILAWVYRVSGLVDTALLAFVLLPVSGWISLWTCVVVAVPAWHRTPVSLVLVIAAYRVAYLGLITLLGHWITKYRPRRYRRLAPRILCRHGARRPLRQADLLLERGCDHQALDAYLRVLVDHPWATGCSRVICLRAAEAAVGAGAQRLAIALAAESLIGIEPQPLAGEAVVEARARAVAALAHASLREHDQAERSVRDAQQVVHRSKPTYRMISRAFVEITIRARRFASAEDAINTVTVLLIRQQLAKTIEHESHLMTVLGDTLPAPTDHWNLIFDLAKAATAVEPQLNWMRRGGRAGADRWFAPWSIPTAWYGRCREWIDANRAQFEWFVRADLPGDERASPDHVAEVISLARWLSEGETVMRVALAASRLAVGSSQDSARHAAEALTSAAGLFPQHAAHYADPAAWERWTAVHRAVVETAALGGAPSDSPTIQGWTIEQHTEMCQRIAESEILFGRLAQASETFAPFHRHTLKVQTELAAMRDAGGAVTAAVEHEATKNGTAPPPIAGPGPEAEAEPPAASPADRSGHDEEPRTPSPEPIPNRAIAWPEPVLPIEQRGWILLQAAAESRVLGHSHVGTEHLLLALCRDPQCAALLAPFGIDAERIRRHISRFMAPDAQASSCLAPRASDLLAQASQHPDCSRGRPIRADIVLDCLLSARDGVGLQILRTLGTDITEARWRSAERLDRFRRVRTGRDVPPYPAMLDPRGTTEGLQQVLNAALLLAAHSGNVVGVEELVRGIAAAGWDRAAWALGLNVTAAERRCAAGSPRPHVTPQARRLWATTIAEAMRSGSPGADPEHLLTAAFKVAPDRISLMLLRDVDQVETLVRELRSPTVVLADDARRIIRTAHDNARGEGHRYLGPEHLARAAVEPANGRHTTPSRFFSGTVASPLPLTPQSKAVLAAGARITQEARAGRIGSQQILDALATPGVASVGARVLAGLGAAGGEVQTWR